MWKYETALKLLEREGRTRKWLADQCGIELGSLNQLLGGNRKPGRPVLKLMSQALRCAETDLISRDPLKAEAVGQVS